MRKIIDLVLLGFLFLFLFWQKETIVYNVKFLTASPCDIPITYRLGEVDSGYGLDKQHFLGKIAEASKIWSSVVGKNLFEFHPNGKITINLIYSERQSMLDNLNQLEENLKSGRQSVEATIAEYKKLEADFKQKIQTFNQEVESWNKQGGAPEEVFNQLIRQQEELKNEADKLNNLANQLNLSVKQYNLGVSQFNQQARNLTQAIREKPEAGLYDGSVPKIDIYLTSSDKELVHTLAHEMGHALGLNHTANPKSIMYPYTNEIIQPDNQEKQELKIYCQQKNLNIILTHLAEKIKEEMKH